MAKRKDKSHKADMKIIKPGKKRGGMMILPAKSGTCAMCATDHPADMPHNLTSLFYGVRFKMKWGRDPTWSDAAAHCDAHIVKVWKEALAERGIEWTSPAEGEPIREPYAESDP